MQRMQKLMRLPEETQIKGMRPMTLSDVNACHKLLTNYLKKFKLSPVFEPVSFYTLVKHIVYFLTFIVE